MATSYTTLLGLALPVTGELAGTWGDTVNNSITSLLDSAVAGTTTLSTDADVTLTTLTGVSNQARQAILLCSGARTAVRNITAPAQSKIYAVVNRTTGGYAVVIRGAGPTTGVTVANGKTAIVVWNGLDFVELSPATATSATNLAGGAAGSLPYQTAAGATSFLGLGAQYTVLTSSGTAPQWSTEIRNATFITCTGNISGTSLTAHPTLQGSLGYNGAFFANTTGTLAIGSYLGGSGSTTLGKLLFIGSGSSERANLSCIEEASGSAAYLSFATRNAANILAERMRLDASGNLGLGVTPSAWATAYKSFDFGARGGLGSEGTAVQLALNAYYNVGWKYKQTAAASFYEQYNGSHAWYAAPSGTAGNAITFAQAMTLDASGNLALGATTAGARLDVTGSTLMRGTVTVYSSTGGAVNSPFLYFGSAALPNAAAVYSNTDTATAGNLIFATSQSGTGAMTERARIDSIGNLGLGGTPSALWSSGGNLQIANGVFTASSDATRLMNNTVFSSALAGGPAYITSSQQATQYLQNAGAHSWYTAPSGTAGGAINFTQVMTLDASGNLAMGASASNARIVLTGPSGDGTVKVSGDGINYAIFDYIASSYGRIGTTTAKPFLFLTDSTERARIDSSGNLGVGATSPTPVLSGSNLVTDVRGTDGAEVVTRRAGGGAVLSTGVTSSNTGYVWMTTNTNLFFGTNSLERMRITAAGDVLVTGVGGLGYGTGSGGAVTQATSRTTGVTINTTNGAITLVSAAGSTAFQSFTVTNSKVAATDTVLVSQASGADKYRIHVTAVAAGSFEITYATTAGTTVEQPVFNFAVIKAVRA